MSDNFNNEDDQHYSNNNDMHIWRGCSVMAIEKKSPDYTVQAPRREPQVFKISKYAADQAIDDAHADVRNGELLGIDEIIKSSIEQYGISARFADAYANVYRRTRRQLANK